MIEYGEGKPFYTWNVLSYTLLILEKLLGNENFEVEDFDIESLSFCDNLIEIFVEIGKIKDDSILQYMEKEGVHFHPIENRDKFYEYCTRMTLGYLLSTNQITEDDIKKFTSGKSE